LFQLRLPSSVLFAVFLGLGCTSRPADPPPVRSEAGPSPAPQVKPAPLDPTFVLVDGEQLQALCVSAALPRAGLEEHGALELSDGRRVPWLAVWLPDPAWASEHTVTPKAWLDAVTQLGRDERNRLESRPPPAPRRTGKVTMNVPCTDEEILDTVITAVFAGKTTALVVAVSGDHLEQETVPLPARPEALMERAYVLAERATGARIKIGTHQLGALADERAPTVRGQWLDAAHQSGRAAD
jgi:hypothetical protein